MAQPLVKKDDDRDDEGMPLPLIDSQFFSLSKSIWFFTSNFG